jgi:hypothetical protein
VENCGGPDENLLPITHTLVPLHIRDLEYLLAQRICRYKYQFELHIMVSVVELVERRSTPGGIWDEESSLETCAYIHRAY